MKKRPYGLLFFLTFRASFRAPAVFFLLFLLPFLLGLVAGEGNRQNYTRELVMAVTDNEKSIASGELIHSLRARGWVLHEMDANEAAPILERGLISGLLRIDKGFSDYLADRQDNSAVSFETSENSLIQSSVRQTLVLRIEAMRTKQTLLLRGEREFKDLSGTVPEDFQSRFEADIRRYSESEAAMPIEYMGRASERVRHTIVVSDLALITLYLSVLAVIFWTKRSKSAINARLASIAGARLTDFTLTYFVYLAAGALAIFVFLMPMRLRMGDPLKADEYFVLLTFYAVILALSSFLRRLDAEIALYLGLMAIFLLALAGGTMTPLPGKLLAGFSQYTPHGWVYGFSVGFPVVSGFYFWMLAAILFVLSAPKDVLLLSKKKTSMTPH